VSESDINRILVAIARVEEKVAGIVADNTRGEAVHQDHETRLRRLEQFRWLIVGAACAASGTGGALLTQLFG
jgi:hypothetical protein